MSSITEGWEKIKSSEDIDRKTERKNRFFKVTFMIVSIFLISSASFGFGRLSAIQERKVPVKIEYNKSALGASVSESKNINSEENKNEGNLQASLNKESGEVVGSKNSDVYHFPWCPGAQRISEANKVTFSSIEKARESGYRPAVNCEGLE